LQVLLQVLSVAVQIHPKTTVILTFFQRRFDNRAAAFLELLTLAVARISSTDELIQKLSAAFVPRGHVP